jgi:hypothetical protein
VQKSPQKRARGRPRTGKVRMQLKLSPQARNLVRQRAGKLGISHSEYVERVILEAEKWEQLRELLNPKSG